MDDGSEIAASLQRSLRRLLVATAALYLIVIVAVVLVYRDANAKRRELARQAADTKQQVATLTAAQCTLRSDLRQRVTASEQFLAEHPNGIPGLPAATIEQSLAGQRRTIAALSGLDCR